MKLDSRSVLPLFCFAGLVALLQLAGSAGALAQNTPQTGDAGDAVLQAFDRLNTAYPYRLTETTTGLGSTTVRVAEFAAADQVHVRLGTGSNRVETIQIGNRSYWFTNGQWAETTNEPRGARSEDIAALLASAVGGAELLGNEILDGVETLAYTFRFELTVSGQAFAGQGKAWISTAEGLPRKIEMDASVGGFTLSTQLVYEYGVDINIAPPIP